MTGISEKRRIALVVLGAFCIHSMATALWLFVSGFLVFVILLFTGVRDTFWNYVCSLLIWLSIEMAIVVGISRCARDISLGKGTAQRLVLGIGLAIAFFVFLWGWVYMPLKRSF